MSVILEVRHVTTYLYARPVRFSTHRVLFRPRAAHDIRVLDAALEVSPASSVRWIHDVFSNSVALVDPIEPAAELRFTASFTIEHQGVLNHELPIAPEAELYPFTYSADEQIDLSGFMQMQYPDDSAAVREWAAQFQPPGAAMQTRELLARINEAMRRHFSYAAREAVGTQRPALTLQTKAGTCRDFALLMMEAARSLGMAARFVSGYIYDPALDKSESTPSSAQASRDAGGTLGSGATHAWLHVFLPGAGWVPFDPTNSLFGGTDLIRVAITRTPEQAAPVSGSWDGMAQDFLGMNVEVQVRRLDAAIVPTAMPACPAT